MNDSISGLINQLAHVPGIKHFSTLKALELGFFKKEWKKKKALLMIFSLVIDSVP